MIKSLKLSQKGADLIKEFEGLRLVSYQCTSDVWTNGWGHTKDVKEGDVITIEQAEQFFKEDIAPAVYEVNKRAGYWNIQLTQGQFDSFVSMLFNLGIYSDCLYSKFAFMANKNKAATFDTPYTYEEIKKKGYCQIKYMEKYNEQSVPLGLFLFRQYIKDAHGYSEGLCKRRTREYYELFCK